MTNIAHNPFNQPNNVNGGIYAGSKWHFYENGTTTPKAVYQDKDKLTPHSNPVLADANGRFPEIWLDGIYSIAIVDASDVAIPNTTMDDYNADIADILSSIGSASEIWFEYDPTTTSGLNLGYKRGYIEKTDGSVSEVSAGTVSIGLATGTSYVYVNTETDTLSSSTLLSSQENQTLLFVVTTSASTITNVDTVATMYREPRPNEYPPGGLFGFECTINSTDSDHDIDIARGSGHNSARAAGNYLKDATTTKRADASWTVGNNQGGMASALTLTAGKYFIFIGADEDGNTDFGFDTSETGANLGLDMGAAGYNYIEVIGGFRTDASGNLTDAWDLRKDKSRVLLDQVTADNITAASLTGLTSELYDKYEIEVVGAVCAQDESDFMIRYGETTPQAASYTYGNQAISAGGEFNSSDAGAATEMVIYEADRIGNDAGGSVNGKIHMYNAADAALFTSMVWNFSFYHRDSYIAQTTGAGCREVAEGTGVVELSFRKGGSQDTNGIVSGVFKLYGIK